MNPYPYTNYPPFPADPTLEQYRQRARELSSQFYQPPNYQQGFQQTYQPQTVVYNVSSLDEARAARIDNPMNTYIFIDASNGKIYTKKIGDNGAAILQSYTPEIPPPMNSEDKFAVLEKRIAELEAQKQGAENV